MAVYCSRMEVGVLHFASWLSRVDRMIMYLKQLLHMLNRKMLLHITPLAYILRQPTSKMQYCCRWLCCYNSLHYVAEIISNIIIMVKNQSKKLWFTESKARCTQCTH